MIALKAPITLQEVLAQGEAYFAQYDLHYGHGYIDAHDEIIAMLLSVLNQPLDYPISKSWLAQSLDPKQLAQLTEWFKRRCIDKVPVAYLIQRAHFAGLTFYVDSRVHIPRSPIAEMLEGGLAPWVGNSESVLRCLDMGTGSGCLAVAMAVHLHPASVLAVEISKPALQVAAKNCALHGCDDRVMLIEGDWLSPALLGTFDVIVSNPPYVSKSSYQSLPKEYHHEPSLSFLAEEDGMDYINRLLTHAKSLLRKEGVLIVEAGEAAEKVLERYPYLPFIWPHFERGGDGVLLLRQVDL